MKHQFRLKPDVKGHALPCVQQIELLLDGQTAGSIRWHAQPNDEGVVQVLDLSVVEGHRRQGYGSQLLKRAYAESAALFRGLGIKPRRVFFCLEQKKHVLARAFLTKHGYQHTSTLAGLYRDQDGMVYQRSFD